MKFSRFLLFSVLVLMLATQVSAAPQQPQTPPALDENQVVAKVGDATITMGDLLFLLASQQGGHPMMAQYLLQQISYEEKQNLVQSIADLEIIANKAKAEKLMDNPDIARQLRWNTANTLANAYISQKLREYQAPDEAVKAEYDANKDKYVKPEEIHARHILVKEEAKAKEILEKLKAGEPFEKLATDNTIDPSGKDSGGDLGWFSKGRMVKPFEDAAFALNNPGDLSDIVSTDFGFHIIKLEEKHAPAIMTFEEAKPEIIQALQKKYVEKLIEDSRNEAKLEILLPAPISADLSPDTTNTTSGDAK